MEKKQFYNITDCRLRHFYGKCLATTRTTGILPAEEQNISKVVEQKGENLISCPDLLHVAVDPFLACKNKDCPRKIPQDQKLSNVSIATDPC